MPYFNPQQQDEGMFPAITGMRQHIHQVVPPVLGGMGGVGGYVVGITQDRVPVALCVAVGVVVGLLLVEILLNLATLLVAAAIVCVTSVACYFLLVRDADLKHPHTPPAVQAAPVAPAKPSSHGLLDDLRKVLP